jgi:hypothetical protein
MEKVSNSAHRFVVGYLENLKNYSCHIKKVVGRQTSKEIINNQMCIKTSLNNLLLAYISSMGI